MFASIRRLSLVLAIGAMSVPAFAQERQGGRGERRGPGAGGGAGGAGGNERFGGGRGGIGQRGGEQQAPGAQQLTRVGLLEKAALEIVTPEQKPKAEATFKSAKEQLDPIKAALQKNEEERRELLAKLTEITDALGNDVNDLLDQDQKAILKDKLATTNGDGRDGRDGRGPGGFSGFGGGNIVQRIAETPDINLTPEQKDKLAALQKDNDAKLATARQAAGGDRQAAAEQFRTTMQQTRTKVNEILTPEQQQKLNQSGGFGGGRGQGGDQNRPGGDRPGARGRRGQ